KTLAVVLAMGMALSLAACGGKKDDGAKSSKGTEEMVVAIDADIDTLHPANFSTTVELNILNQIYDTLMYMNPDETHEPEPRIAEKYEISKDGLEYTFHLRKDVTFHDGSKLTAADVKYSLEMYQASEYQGYEVDGLASVETPDDYTVVCHLEYPYSPFLLGVCNVHIASKSYSEKSAEDFANIPMGTGPYKYVKREKGSSISLEAYKDYYRGEAAIKKVNFEVVPNEATMAVALQSGEINFAGIQSSSIAQLEANKNITITRADTSAFAYVCMNLEKEPFKDAKVRQAVNYALNRDNIVQVCFDGEAEVNSNICAKTRMGYKDTQFQYTYDVEKAKKLLKEAGISTPYNLGEMLVAEKYSDLAAVIQSDLKAIGFETTIKVAEFNSYIGDLTSGNYTISALNMTLDGDTQSLEMAFDTDAIGMANNARYSDKEMDKLFAEAKTESDTDKRMALFDKAFSKAQEEAVYAVIGNPKELFAYNNSLNVPEIAFEGAYFIYDFSWK
ncbi:MAG: ABC transporter substrate-binding protein, partial [Lachnospiraceae bacterium]|nr:ABC transporter substrate-binding protein [Lachnospiraceae bacterium]